MTVDGRVLGEPTYRELQLRIARWLIWRWKQWEAAGRTKVSLAQGLGLSKVTVGNIINGKELPGLECFMKMHWRLQLDAYRMLHADPDEDVGSEWSPSAAPASTTHEAPASRRTSRK